MIRYRSIGFALAINVFFLILCLSMHHLRFAAIDDYFMAGILSGIYGNEYNVHLPFVNAIYAYCLLPLYHLYPKICWYYIGELASVFISLTCIVYLLVKTVGIRWGAVLGTLFVAVCAKDLYVTVQFTLCAEILSATGMLLFLYGFNLMSKEPQSRKKAILFVSFGILMLWWGSFMRWEAFLMGLPFFAVALLFFVRKFWNCRKYVIVALVLFGIGAVGSHLFNQSLYTDSSYKQFVEFQPFRVLLGDGSFYNENAIYEDLQEMGASPKDFDLLKKWYFYDNEVFAPDSVKIYEDLIAKYTVKSSNRVLPMMLLCSLERVAYTPIFFIWVVFSIVLVCSNKRGNLFLWISLAFVLGMYIYLLDVNRVVYRVEFGFFFYVTVLSIVFWKRLRALPGRIAFILVAGILVVSSCIYYDAKAFFRNPNNGRSVAMHEVLDRKGYEQLFLYMDSAPDSVLFVVPMDTYMDLTEHRLPPYLNEPMGSWQRIIPTGFWTPYYPDVEQSFRSRGMTNPMKDIVNDNVYFVSDIKFGTSLVDFLQRHYFDSVAVDTVKHFSDVSLLKYRVVDAGGR